mgnify:CR=1 FL=1
MENKEIINALIELSKESSQVAIEAYSQWYLINAITWFSVGLIIVILSKRTSRMFEDLDFYYRELVRPIMIVLGILIMAMNVTNIFSSDAYAIHSLIRNIRG